MSTPLPFIDEQTRVVAAPGEDVWRAAAATMAARPNAATERYGRLVGVRGERPFVVESSEPPHRLVLVGEHRYSRYSLIFTVDDLGSGLTALRAQTWAVFPGIAGRFYRALVIDSRAHVFVVRRLLARITRKAQRA